MRLQDGFDVEDHPLEILLDRWNGVDEGDVLCGLAVGAQTLENARALLHLLQNVNDFVAVRGKAFGQQGHDL